MKNPSFIKSISNAFAGLKHCLITERNFKFHVFAAVCVIMLCIYLRISSSELVDIIFAIFFVLAAETLNTAIEAVCDMYTSQYNKYVKVAKDCAAGVVLLSSINAVIVGVIIFSPKLL